MTETVPVITCRHCGDSYLTAQVMRELDRIKARRSEVAVRRQVRVAAYAGAA